MKRVAVFFAAFLVSFSALAQQASDATVERLMTVTRAQALVETMMGGMDQLMDAAMKAAVKEPLTPEQQRKLDELAPTRHSQGPALLCRFGEFSVIEAPMRRFGMRTRAAF